MFHFCVTHAENCRDQAQDPEKRVEHHLQDTQTTFLNSCWNSKLTIIQNSKLYEKWSLTFSVCYFENPKFTQLQRESCDSDVHSLRTEYLSLCAHVHKLSNSHYSYQVTINPSWENIMHDFYHDKKEMNQRLLHKSNLV